ncbi:hypothetical protein C8R43DRAFT_949100 [Mycena crocata]|nr:hypothetical protein C8R43DRAFT_949100 [Mycena crocata]
MADESNDDRMGNVSSELSELEGSINDFVVRDDDDGDVNMPDAVASAATKKRARHRSASNDAKDGSPPPRTPQRSGKKIRSRSVVLSSDDENASALVGDDKCAFLRSEKYTQSLILFRMFTRGSGVKASLLPEGLVTRSRKREAPEAPYESPASQQSSPTKRAKGSAKPPRKKVKTNADSDVEFVEERVVSEPNPGSISNVPKTPKYKTSLGNTRFPSPVATTLSTSSAQLDLPCGTPATSMSDGVNDVTDPAASLVGAALADVGSRTSNIAQASMESYVDSVFNKRGPLIAADVLSSLMPMLKSIEQTVSAMNRGEPSPAAPGSTSSSVLVADVAQQIVAPELSESRPRQGTPQRTSSTLPDTDVAKSGLHESAMPRSPPQGRKEQVDGPVMHLDASFSSLSQKSKSVPAVSLNVNNSGPDLDDMFGGDDASEGPPHTLPPDGPTAAASTKPALDHPPLDESKATASVNTDHRPLVKGKGKAVEQVKDEPDGQGQADLDDMFSDEEDTAGAPAKSVPKDQNVDANSKCLDDLESYKNRFDPMSNVEYSTNPCKTPSLKQHTLVSLRCQLGDSSTLLTFHRILRTTIPSVTTMSSAMSATRDGVYVNPARVSPAAITTRPTQSGSMNMRVNVDSRVAICWSPGMILESFLTDPTARRKYIALLLHSQEWQRWEAFMCLVFAEEHLFSPMTRLAIHIGSVINQGKGSQSQRAQTQAIDSRMTSPIKTGASRSLRPPTQNSAESWRDAPGRAKYSYLVDEDIPIYNALGKNFDFSKDLPNLAELLPRWSGDIPAGSFAVAGYTASSYKGKAGGQEGKFPHVGCNLVWAVVCGVPKGGA